VGCSILALFSICLLFIPVRADKVDDYIYSQLKKRKIPGASVSILHKNRLVKARGYGLANVELRTPATRHTVYEIGSISKQFTATLTMLLITERRLALQDPVSKYLKIPDHWNSLTIKDLLSMTSGIRGHAEIPHFSMRSDYTDEEFIRLFWDEPLAIRPGEAYYYTSTGYNLLAMIIEKVSGRSFEELLEERIFKPVGLRNTRVKEFSEVVRNRADGYYLGWTGEYRKSEPHRPKVLTASGGVLSSVMDLARLDRALNNYRLLTREQTRMMWTPVELNNGLTYPYGFGWFVNQFRGHRMVYHSGGMPGFTAMFAKYLDDNLTVIVLTNLYNAKADQIARGIADHYVRGLSTTSLRARPDPDPPFTSRLTQALNDLYAGRRSALLLPDLVSNTPVSKKAEISSHLRSLKAIQFLEKENVKTLRIYRNGAHIFYIYRYRLMTSDESYFYTVELSADGRLAGLTIEQ
jgi:D-alanyl-D-alanine carboxypeptidase